MLLVTGFTLVGEGINDILNPLIRQRRLEQPEIPVEPAEGMPAMAAVPGAEGRDRGFGGAT